MFSANFILSNSAAYKALPLIKSNGAEIFLQNPQIDLPEVQFRQNPHSRMQKRPSVPLSHAVRQQVKRNNLSCSGKNMLTGLSKAGGPNQPPSLCQNEGVVEPLQRTGPPPLRDAVQVSLGNDSPVCGFPTLFINAAQLPPVVRR